MDAVCMLHLKKEVNGWTTSQSINQFGKVVVVLLGNSFVLSAEQIAESHFVENQGRGIFFKWV
jgi:fucose permease